MPTWNETRQTISVKGGSIAIVPLTVAQDCSLHVDATSVLIIWDDDADDISSVRAEMRMAMELAKAREAREPVSPKPTTTTATEPSPEDAPSGPVLPMGVKIYNRPNSGD